MPCGGTKADSDSKLCELIHGDLAAWLGVLQLPINTLEPNSRQKAM